MTDERGGRYFREARFFLAGDKVAAQSHILEARRLMGYMRDMHSLGGPPIQVKYATLQDGTQIKATMMNGQYQAEIISPEHSATERDPCEMYIESGPLEVGYFTTGNLSLVESSILYEIANPIADDLPGAVSTPDGAGTSIYRLPPQPEAPPPEPAPAECTVDVPDGGGETTVDLSCMQCKQYVDQCSLTAKKLRADYFNPSRYTGKMRLFMQAILGSDPMRIGGFTNADQNKQIPATVTSFLLDRRENEDGSFSGALISFTTMLFCDENKNYWLVDAHAGASETSVRRMLFQPCADAILAELKSGAAISRDRLLQLETVLFAYVDPATALGATHQVGHDPILGAPIANGWHGAYGLFEAVQVGHVFYGLGSSQYFTARLQRMVFSTTAYDAAAGAPPAPPGIVIETEETSNWYGKHILDQVLGPDYANNVCSSWTFDMADDVNGDAPIYAFYTLDDTIQLVRYVNTSGGAFGATSSSAGSCGVALGYTYSGSGYAGGNRGFYITGHTDTIKPVKSSYTYDNKTFNWRDVLDTYQSFGVHPPGMYISGSNYWGGICGDCYPATSISWADYFAPAIQFAVDTHIYRIATTAKFSSHRDQMTDGNIRANSFVLIPLNCPDAAYVGSAGIDDRYSLVTDELSTTDATRRYAYTVTGVSGGAGQPHPAYPGQPVWNNLNNYPSATVTQVIQQEIVTEWNINLATQTGVIVVGGGTETRLRTNGGGGAPPPDWPPYSWPEGLASWTGFLGMDGEGVNLHGLRVEQSVGGLLRYQPTYDAGSVTNSGNFPSAAHVFLGWV